MAPTIWTVPHAECVLISSDQIELVTALWKYVS